MSKDKRKRLPINQINEFTFREGDYKIFYKKPHCKDADGICYPPPQKFTFSTSKIYIDPCLPEKDFLKTVIDELIHCNLWEIDNEVVGEISENIGEFLWKLGFRLQKPNNKKV